MKAIANRDKKKRAFFYKNELVKLVNSSLWKSSELSFVLRYRFFLLCTINAKKINKANLRTRCVLTGRGRAIFTTWKLSRLQFRDYTRTGWLLGVKKHSF